MDQNKDHRKEDTRRFERFRTTEPLYAFMEGRLPEQCRVRDISRGGLGIECSHLDTTAFPRDPSQEFKADLSIPGSPVAIERIPLRLVHMTEMGPDRDPDNENTRTRVGMQFGELTREQATGLERLFSQFCIQDNS